MATLTRDQIEQQLRDTFEKQLPDVLEREEERAKDEFENITLPGLLDKYKENLEAAFDMKLDESIDAAEAKIAEDADDESEAA